MGSEVTWLKCKHCMFATKKSIIVQFKEGDVDRWQYCPCCGEEWEEAILGTTEA